METKFTDQHVRSHPELRTIAADYLRGYTGEFDPIIAAKELLTGDDKDLPLPIVRLVLNVMRIDPRACHLVPDLVPTRGVHTEESVEQAFVRAKAERAPKQKYRPTYIDLKVKWNKEFIAATTKNATAYHLLSPQHSTLRYWPYVGKYRMDMRTWCGQRLSTGVALDEPPQGRHACRQCGINKETIEARALENQARLDELKGNAA